jgi:molybdopterin-guanine dinucleotide biosynthesis protein A
MREPRSDVLGVIIAGGQSTRYGSPKALATVGGKRAVDHVIAALRAVVDDVVVIANDPDLAESIGVAWRSDRVSGLGPLGGFDAALRWAVERACVGVLAVACDMPFLSPELLSLMADRGVSGWADAVLPSSNGPRGVEPLAAYYSVACIPAIDAAASRGDNRLIGFHADVVVTRVSLEEVSAFGDPDEMFLNMNTPADAEHIEQIFMRRQAV